jgi:type I restriction enzyme R subunit
MPIARRLESARAKPMKSIGTGGASLGRPGRPTLRHHQKMNEVFSGNLSDADFKGYITMLIGKMVDDPTLQEQAQANDTDAIC